MVSSGSSKKRVLLNCFVTVGYREAFLWLVTLWRRKEAPFVAQLLSWSVYSEHICDIVTFIIKSTFIKWKCSRFLNINLCLISSLYRTDWEFCRTFCISIVTFHMLDFLQLWRTRSLSVLYFYTTHGSLTFPEGLFYLEVQAGNLRVSHTERLCFPTFCPSPEFPLQSLNSCRFA